MAITVIMQDSRPDGAGGTYKKGSTYSLPDTLATYFIDIGLAKRTSTRSEQTGLQITGDSAGRFPSAPAQDAEETLKVRRNSVQGVRLSVPRNAFTGCYKSGIKPMRPMSYIDGITMPVNGGGAASFAQSDLMIDGERTVKVATGGSVSTITLVADLSAYGEYIKASELKNIGLRFYIKNAAKLGYINCDLGGSSSFNNAFVNTAGVQSPPRDGLYEVPLYDEDWTVKTGAPANVDLTHIKFTILGLSGNASGDHVEIYIGRPVIFGPRKSVLGLTYDDGHEKSMEIADLLESYGLLGTFFIYTDGIGQPGNLTWSQCRELDSRGHCIAIHNKTHESQQTLGDKVYYSGQLWARDAILDNVGPRGASHVAYVGGWSSPVLIKMLHAAGFVSGHGNATDAGLGLHHPGFGGNPDNLFANSRWRTERYNMNKTHTTQWLIDRMNVALAYGMDVMHYGHHIGDAATELAYSRIKGNPYSMPDLFAAYKEKIDQGLMHNQTVDKYWDEQLPLVGPDF